MAIPWQRDTDEFAALAWYHRYVLDTQQALSAWNDQAEKVRGKRDMTSHLALLDWWAPTEIEQRTPKTFAEANVLNCLGLELSEATLGNRTLNLRRAIACHEAALRVYTEADFPSAWATMQNNLGNAYGNLPTGTGARTSAAPSPATRRHCGSDQGGLPRGVGEDPKQPGHRLLAPPDG